MLEMLSETLFNLRREKGCTQKEVATYAGITPAALSAYEKGTKTPQLETAAKLAKYYGVSLDSLCGIKNEQSTEKQVVFTREDALRILTTLYANMPFSIEHKVTINEEYGAKYYTLITIYTGEDDWICEYFDKFITLMKLYTSKDIDWEVLEAWKDKKFEENSRIAISSYSDGSESSHIFVTDEELPF